VNPNDRRYPVAPLLAVLAERADGDRILTQHHRCAAAGGLTELTADRLAVRLGLHPAVIWPEWFSHDTVADILATELPDETPADRERRLAREWGRRHSAKRRAGVSA